MNNHHCRCFAFLSVLILLLFTFTPSFSAGPSDDFRIKLVNRTADDSRSLDVGIEDLIYTPLLEAHFDEPPFDWSGMVPQGEVGWVWSSDNGVGNKPPLMKINYDTYVEETEPLTSPAVDVSEFDIITINFVGNLSYEQEYSDGVLDFVAEVSDDGGASWQKMARSSGYCSGPVVHSTVGVEQVMVRFWLDSSGGSAFDPTVEVDEVLIHGVTEPPTSEGDGYIYEVEGPLLGLPGVPERVGIFLDMDLPVVSVRVEHGTFDGTTVNNVESTDLQCDPDYGDTWEGEIPGDQCTAGDDVAWRIVCEDIGGGTMVTPDGSSTPEDETDDWYGFHVYADTPQLWNTPDMQDGDFWVEQAPWEFNPQAQPPSDVFSPPDDRETICEGEWDPTPMICTESDGNYPDNADCYLGLDMDIVPGPDCVFAWNSLLYCQSGILGGVDGYNVEASVDGGSWFIITPVGGYTHEVMALNFYSPGFSGYAGRASNAIDLSPYTGQTVNLRFHFASDGANDQDYPGVWIYQVMVAGADILGREVAGTVTDGDSNPIMDADILIWPVGVNEENTPPILQTKSDENGSYSLFPLSIDDFYMRAFDGNSAPVTSPTVTVNNSETVLYGFQMSDALTDEDFSGQVICEVAQTGIASDGLCFSGTDYTATPDVDGYFTFTSVPTGCYDLVIESDPPGSQGYHTSTYTGQFVEAGDVDVHRFCWPVIRTPEVLTLEDVGSHRVSFEVSENLVPSGVIEKWSISAPETLSTEYVKIPPKLGYRVRLNGNYILPDLFPSRSITLDNLENGREYTIETAVEYGYGDEFLVWSYPITATPDTKVMTVTHPLFEWVEIRPDSGGSGTNLYISSYTTLNDIGGTFNYFGTDHTSMRVYADGVIAFDLTTQINYFNPELGSGFPPNSLIAPYWIDLATGYNSGEAIWYWNDTAENRTVIQWHAPHYTYEGLDNAVDFEVILDFDDNSILFQYLTTESGWSTDALVGLEDPDGVLAVAVDATDLADEYTLRVAFEPPSYGTVSGHIVDALGEPIKGAIIGAVGQRPQTWSDSNGDWFITLLEGTYDLKISSPGFAGVKVTGASVTAATDLQLGTQTLGKVQGDVDVTELELNVPLVEGSGAQSTSFNLTNTGDGTMQPYVWWSAMPNFEYEYVGGGTAVASAPANPLEWIGDGVTSRERPVMHSEEVATVRGPAVARKVSSFESFLHFNASTAVTPTSYEMFGVGVTNAGIHLNDFAATVGLYNFSATDPYSFINKVSFPEGVNMFNGFSLDMPNDCMISVDSEGRVWRFNSDLSILELLGNVGIDANGCAYNWMTNEIYAYTWGSYWSNVPETFVVCDLNTGEIKHLTVPHGIGVVSDLTFVPNDPDGLYIHALTQYHDHVYVHRYNHRHDFWEQSGELVMVLPSDYDDACGFFATPWFSLNETTAKSGEFAAEERMDYVTAYIDQSGYTFVDAWRGPKVPKWLVIEGPSTELAPAESGNFTVTVDLSQDPTFVPMPESDTYVEIKPGAEYWTETPTVTLIIHWGPADDAPETALLPDQYALHPAYPNPFNPTATLRYDLPEASMVSMVVYNIMGQEVTLILDGKFKPAGYHSVQFDGSGLAAGVYFVRFESEAFSKVRKMVLLK